VQLEEQVKITSHFVNEGWFSNRYGPSLNPHNRSVPLKDKRLVINAGLPSGERLCGNHYWRIITLAILSVITKLVGVEADIAKKQLVSYSYYCVEVVECKFGVTIVGVVVANHRSSSVHGNIATDRNCIGRYIN
jgi:hypothetical protein